VINYFKVGVIMSRSSSFIEGAIFGLVAGFVGGILLAPRSGKETRDRLKQFKKDNEYRLQDVKDRTEDLIAQTLEAIDTGLNKVGGMVNKKKEQSFTSHHEVDVYGR